MNELTPEGKFNSFGIQPYIRRPKYQDSHELASALRESSESISEFLEWGYASKYADRTKCLRIIQQDLSQLEPDITYYVFDRNKLIGTTSFGWANQINGIQITYWVRKSYQNLGIGKWLFQEMRDHAFYVWNYDFVEIHTDSANTGSQALAVGAGGQEWFRYDYETKAWGASGEMIVWGIDHPAIKFEKRVNRMIIGQLHRPNFGSVSS